MVVDSININQRNVTTSKFYDGLYKYKSMANVCVYSWLPNINTNKIKMYTLNTKIL